MSDERESTAHLLSFLTNFTLLVERELLAIRESVVTTVEAVMKGIEDISQTVGQNKIDAEQILEFTYLNPDEETEGLMDGVQRLADEVIASAFEEMGGVLRNDDQASRGNSEQAMQNELTQLNQKLNQSIGQLAKLDDSVIASVFSIVGALSSEDLIAQRLEHTILSLKSLQTGLSFLLIDYEERCRSDEIERVIKSILTYTYRQYTAEEEKDRFHIIFGRVAV